MSAFSDTLEALRQAVLLSPDNLPSRQHFAEVLFQHGVVDEAEKEFREALKLAPKNTSLKLGLVQVF